EADAGRVLFELWSRSDTFQREEDPNATSSSAAGAVALGGWRICLAQSLPSRNPRRSPARFRAWRPVANQQEILMTKMRRRDMEHVEPLFQLSPNVTKR